MNRYVFCLAAALLAAPAHAQQYEDLDALDRRIADASGVLGTTAEAIDRRIKLPRCPEAASLDTGASGMIAVRCASLGWRLRVPVSASIVVSEMAEPIIRRGQSVAVEIVGDAFSVSYDAVAMDEGAVGKSIRVKFSTNGAFFAATVTGPGKVQMAD